MGVFPQALIFFLYVVFLGWASSPLRSKKLIYSFQVELGDDDLEVYEKTNQMAQHLQARGSKGRCGREGSEG